MVHFLLTSESMMKKRNKPSKPPWTYFYKEWHLLKKSLGQVLQAVIQKKALLSYEMTAPSKLLPLKTLQWDKMWRWKTGILMILTLC